MYNTNSKIKIAIAKDKDNNDVLIQNANKNNKYYCYDCDEELIPKKGKIKIHHYAHKSKNKCTGESWQHKYCKKIIGQYLPNLHFEYKCENCSTQNHYEFNNHICTEEWTYQSYIFDLALHENNNIDTAIEIYHKHKTEQNKMFDIIYQGIKFIEVSTHEVLSKIENILQNKNTNLKCMKTLICEKCCEYKIIKEIEQYVGKYADYFNGLDFRKGLI